MADLDIGRKVYEIIVGKSRVFEVNLGFGKGAAGTDGEAFTIPDLAAIGEDLADADLFPIYNASTATHEKVTLSVMAAYIAAGAGAVSSVFGDTGAVTIPGLDDKATPIGADTLAIYDSVGADHAESTLASLPISTAAQTALNLKADTSALHDESHTVASHSDTTATGLELDELTDGSETTLHSHAGGGGDVTSVFTRSGDVVAVTDDYTWAQIDKTTSVLNCVSGIL